MFPSTTVVNINKVWWHIIRYDNVSLKQTLCINLGSCFRKKSYSECTFNDVYWLHLTRMTNKIIELGFRFIAMLLERLKMVSIGQTLTHCQVDFATLHWRYANKGSELSVIWTDNGLEQLTGWMVSLIRVCCVLTTALNIKHCRLSY